MSRKITRRDFLDGVAIGVGAAALSPGTVLGQPTPAATPQSGGEYYPPLLTGLRGSHEGSYEVAHALAWQNQKPARYRKLDEHYDLVVVGAGISGLAAAWFYRKKMGPDARILLIENHDDFGGHAKRNEFQYQGRTLLGIGGAQNLEFPEYYSDIAKGVLDDLGIDTEQMRANMTADFPMSDFQYPNAMAVPTAEGHKTVGGNWVLFMHGEGEYADAVRELPIDAAEQDKLIAFLGGENDYLDELSYREKYRYARTTPYNVFLRDKVGLAESTLPLLDVLLRANNGFSGWNHSVVEAIELGAPGLQGFGWLGEFLDYVAVNFGSLYEARYFPDGNASVARLLVHKLIPDVAPAMAGFADVATRRFDYAALDLPDNATRVRLNSTAVGVRNIEGGKVEVDYVTGGDAQRVTANHCILACYNGLIPHLCPELPDAQKEALKYGVKIPFVYSNVLLRNGQAFSKLGANLVTCPYDYYSMVSCAPPTRTGGFQPPSKPEDPRVLFMMAGPTPNPQGGESARDLFRLGRTQLYATSFDTYEAQIRSQLQSMLGPHEFDHETDIEAITVNRWSHGYAYFYFELYDPEWQEGEAPHEIGRAPFDRISIANSDSEARAYIDAAMDAAWRAVEEQTAQAS